MAKAHEDLGHPSQSQSSRYPLDALLRRHGFTIFARPARGEPVWIDREGKRWKQSAALGTLPKKEVEAARHGKEVADEQC